MPIRVLIVDDSGFFRRRVAEMLKSDSRLEVIDTAADGAEAVAKNASLRPDVITMDIEMPVMDGITAVRRIMASSHPAPVLMFSSLTTDGARATLDAMEAGAVDYLPKKFEDISLDREEARRLLCEKVHAVGKGGRARATAAARPAPRPTPAPRPSLASAVSARPAAAAPTPTAAASRGRALNVVGIGTSTGGPVALQEVLTKFPGNFPLPIVLVQHMPGSFTPAFAQRLDQQCAISVREAKDGDSLEPGLALLAPGGKQMLVERRGTRTTIRIEEPAPDQNYKPSVDVTFSSLAQAFPGQALGVILTGMGADGREGARLMKSGGSSIWAQDEATSVVYGMPAAVTEAGISEQSLPLPEIGGAIVRRVM